MGWRKESIAYEHISHPSIIKKLTPYKLWPICPKQLGLPGFLKLHLVSTQLEIVTFNLQNFMIFMLEE